MKNLKKSILIISLHASHKEKKSYWVWKGEKKVWNFKERGDYKLNKKDCRYWLTIHLYFWRSNLPCKLGAGSGFNKKEVLENNFFRIEHPFISSQFNCKLMKPCRKSTTAHKCIKPWYNSEYFTRTINIELFMERHRKAI